MQRTLDTRGAAALRPAAGTKTGTKKRAIQEGLKSDKAALWIRTACDIVNEREDEAMADWEGTLAEW